jgi:alginate O-acetyltransferase complex protein AlgI
MPLFYLIFFIIYIYFYYKLPYYLKNNFILVSSLALIFLVCSILTFACVIIYSILVFLILKFFKRKKSKLILFFSLLILTLPIIITRAYSTDLNSRFIEIAGLSFYFFGSVAIVINSFHDDRMFGENILNILSFNSFYPKFLSGPIATYDSYASSLIKPKHFNYNNILSGLKIIIFAIFIKTVIADRISPVVDSFYNDPSSSRGIYICLILFLYLFQIYYDFRSYSDIAIGSARCLGFNLPQNFNNPYYSTSISEYWRRWHISLMSWFYKYVYFPVAASLRSLGEISLYISLYIVMIISSFWHGFELHYLVFGMAHASAMCIELKTRKITNIIKAKLGSKIYKFITWSLTFTFLCLIGVLFRANNIHETISIWRNIIIGIPLDFNFIFNNNFNLYSFKALITNMPVPKSELILIFLGIIITETYPYIKTLFEKKVKNNRLKSISINIILSLTIMFIIFFNGDNNALHFTYTQF